MPNESKNVEKILKKQKTVEYISKEPKQGKNNDDSQILKEEISLHEVVKNKEEENKHLKEEILTLQKEVNRLKEENKQITDKNQTYKNYLSSLKEKSIDLIFFDQDEYKEESAIGKGSTSIVTIVHKRDQEKYAKKELLLFDHKSMQRFLGECELLFKLRHPCIIRVYATHKPSIILSLEPKSLETAIKNKELIFEEKNRITIEIVLGMRYIHKHKFIHRDLKPMNILLSKNNHVRITDFGLAKEENATQTKGVGTLLFMAPELFDEKSKYNNKIDVYSFGIVLIFIVTDEYPLHTVITGVLPVLSEDIPEWVRNLINSCLSRKSSNRPSFAEIFEIMEEHNFDLFSDSKNKKLTKKQKDNKNIITARIMKIEAFEYQHQ